MAKSWQDRGNGQWKLTVTSDDPTDSPSVFYGTRDEMTDKLADAQANANRRIAELRRNGNGNGHQAVSPNEPRPLSASDRMQTVAELSDPATVDKAVTRVLESVVGPVETLRASQAQGGEERRANLAAEAAEQFSRETPDWFASDHNKNTLLRYMMRMGGDPTNPAHYTRAFEELSAAQLLQAIPSDESANLNDEPGPERERNAPTPTQPPKAPTRTSTGIRASDISGLPPRPTNRLKYTREQIANLSAAEYKRLMFADQEFSRCVDYYAKPKRQAVG
jgi:hypothetical protein